MRTFLRIAHGLLATLSVAILGSPMAWAQEAASPPPGEGSQIPPTDWGLQIWTLVAFVVLLVLLSKFAFKPIAQALDRRGETIKKSIEEARQLGERVRKEVVDKANAEASAGVQRAQEEIQRQKEKGIQEMKDTVAALSVQIASRVIEKELDDASHHQLVESLIKDLGKVRRD